MNKIKNKKSEIFAVVILSVILLSSSVTALGVAIPYWDKPEWYPLKLAPGESKTVILTLQNTEPNDMTLKASVDGEIASLIGDTEYLVPSGEINKPVKVKVEVPDDVKIGTRYKVYSSFKQISSGEGGMLRLAGALTINFPVEVVGEKDSELYSPSKEKPIKPWVWALVAILAIGIVIALIKKKQKIKKK